jgi:hypothetical protein
MDGTISMDEARALVGDALLWPRVRDFLWDFAPLIHPSWLEGETVGQLNGFDFAHLDAAVKLSDCRTVKRHILASLHVEPCFHAFPKDDGSRLLLLDAATLDAIAKWLGALACAEALRKVTDGATVRNLKAALPGVYPEVFGFAAYFGKWKIENGEWIIGKDDVPQISCLGCRILFSVLSSLPAPLLRRLELKLPKNSQTSDAGTASEVPDSQFSTFNFQFIAKLLKLRFPEACSLCC